jgi:hypothetical protein
VPDLNGQAGELRFTLEITRAATGLTETVELIGKIIPDDNEALTDGSNPLNSGS